MKTMWMMRSACAAVLAGTLLPALAEPSGAKAIFDSGGGGSIAMSAQPAAPARPQASAETAKPGRYVGISYQILSLADDGRIVPVTQKRVFRSGERLRLVARVNRAGYLTVLNVGPTGNTHVLFNEFVEPFRSIDIPRNSNLRLVGAPGTERLLFMLSSEPNPIGQPSAAPASPSAYSPPAPSAAPAYAPPPVTTAAPAYTPPATGYPPASPGALPMSPPPLPEPGSSFAGLPPPPPAAAMVASIDSAKSASGAKDLVAEDSLSSSYSVISPRDAWRPRQMGVKDLVLESQGGSQYGVVPVSAMSGGGILTLEVKLRHQ